MINVIVVDDHILIREALVHLLRKSGEFNVLGEAEHGQELFGLLEQHSPDVVILDLEMPVLSGLETLRRISDNGATSPPVLVLSAGDSNKCINAALDAGAKGYLTKQASLDELKFALKSVLDGKTYLSPSVTDKVMSGAEDTEMQGQNPLNVLTKRELEVLEHLANGTPNRQIGEKLGISTRTVDTHRTNILKKLNLGSTAELVKVAIAHQLVTL